MMSEVYHLQQKLAGLREKAISKLALNMLIVLMSATLCSLSFNYIYPMYSLILLLAQITLIVSSFMLSSSTASMHQARTINDLAKIASRINALSMTIAVSIGVTLGIMVQGISYATMSITLGLFVISMLVSVYIAQNRHIRISGYDISKAIYVILGLSLILIVGSMFMNMQWLEVIICGIAIPVSIGMVSLELRNVNAFAASLDNYHSDDRAKSKMIDVLSIYASARILLHLYNLFMYILRLVMIFSNDRRRR